MVNTHRRKEKPKDFSYATSPSSSHGGAPNYWSIQSNFRSGLKHSSPFDPY